MSARPTELLLLPPSTAPPACRRERPGRARRSDASLRPRGVRRARPSAGRRAAGARAPSSGFEGVVLRAVPDQLADRRLLVENGHAVEERVPEVGASAPVSMPNVVDLPAPLTPSRPKHSPSSMRRQRSRTATFDPNSFRMPAPPPPSRRPTPPPPATPHRPTRAVRAACTARQKPRWWSRRRRRCRCRSGATRPHRARHAPRRPRRRRSRTTRTHARAPTARRRGRGWLAGWRRRARPRRRPRAAGAAG